MNTCFFGDCRESMRNLIAQGVKVQMCVTSPPYFGLRDYGHPDQLGLESTPEQYIANMVEVFRLVRELLADDGVLWLNIGDSYAGSWGNAGGHNRGKGTQREITVGSAIKNQAERNGSFVPPGARGYKDQGIKPKDLIGIPWMLAFALRADGWYLRQDIIWHKPNPMPESVTDRCTKSHEYLFLLSKSEKYYFDSEAIKEPAISAGQDRGGSKAYVAEYEKSGDQRLRTKAGLCKIGITAEMKNKRTVWTIPTRPYKGAHFATFPPALIEPCILAGSRPNDIVLDPFFGSGTTGQVAQQFGRQWIGCELNAAYKELQQKRIQQFCLNLTENIHALRPPQTPRRSRQPPVHPL